MKTLLFFAGVLAAGLVGYSFEPSMRYTLTGKMPEEKPYTPRGTDVPEEVAATNPAVVPVVPVAPVAPVAPPVVAPVEAPVVTPPPTPVPEVPVAIVPVAPAPVEPTTPTPAPVPVAPVPSAPAETADVVAVMKASITAGEIKEFTFDQVLDWQPGGVEVGDGESYQTGVASYKAETVFGVKTIQAKALIKGGKVVKWLWPKSGMEIK
jgi:hypothetical protein